MFMRLLLGKRMLVKKAVMTILMKPVKTKVMELPEFQIWEHNKTKEASGYWRYKAEACAP